MDSLFLLLVYLAAFLGSLLTCYGLVRAWYRLIGKHWTDYQ